MCKNELIIKKSKFIAFYRDIESRQDVMNFVKELKNNHPKSRHVVYAYVLSNSAGMSDDGEPSGTAGKPLFKLLELKKVNNKAIFVVRYFGGKKLGASLLLRSYVNSAKELIK